MSMNLIIPGFFFAIGMLLFYLTLHIFLNSLYSVKAGRDGKLINARILSIRKKYISSGRSGGSRTLSYATVKAPVEIKGEVLVDNWHKAGSMVLIYKNYMGKPCMYREEAIKRNVFTIIGVFLMGALFTVVAVLLKVGLDHDLGGS